MKKQYLSEWAEEHKTAVKWSPFYFRKCQVILKKIEFIKFYIEAKKDCYKFNFLDESGIVFSGKIKHDESGQNDFFLEYKKKSNILKNEEKSYIHFLQVFCTAFINCNCYMWLGNLVENKKYSASGKNDGEDKIITFRQYKDSVYAVDVGKHRSPEGVFSVRGHFRKYKNGKIIWIDEFLKGINKNEN